MNWSLVRQHPMFAPGTNKTTLKCMGKIDHWVKRNQWNQHKWWLVNFTYNSWDIHLYPHFQDSAEKVVGPNQNFDKFEHWYVKKCVKSLLVLTKSCWSCTKGLALVSILEHCSYCKWYIWHAISITCMNLITLSGPYYMWAIMQCI